MTWTVFSGSVKHGLVGSSLRGKKGLVQDGFVQWTKDKMLRVLTWIINKMNCSKPASLSNSYIQQVFLCPANVFRVKVSTLGVVYPHHLTYSHHCRTKRWSSYSHVNCLLQLETELAYSLAWFPCSISRPSPLKVTSIDRRGANVTTVFLLVFPFPFESQISNLLST